MKVPGPAHSIEIAPHGKRVRVVFAGVTIADTTRALTLRETGYALVYYIPREDAALDKLKRSTHASYCPYKGDANYFSIVAGGRVSENAAWTYEQPYPAMNAIKEYLAFYPDRVERIEEG